jgi:c-di-GMP-binding flagellar brake protein YcgR
MERAYLIPQLLASDTLREYKNICLHCIQFHQDRREDSRVSVSFFVSCKHPDRIELRGDAYNLSVGGLAMRTNYPIGTGEQLILEFREPTTFKPVRLVGQVAWRKFNGDTPSEEDTLFSAGIKFLDLSDPTRALISKSIKTWSD